MDFERLYDDNVASMVGQVYVLTGDLGEAQDAVQEAWVRAWLRWERVGTYDQPLQWVRRVAMNLAVSRWRRTRRIVIGAVRAESAVPDGGLEDHVDLRRALAALPVAARRVVVLHHLVGLSVDEIATELGVPAGTVKSRLSRARRSLADSLGAAEAEPHDREGPCP
jgi:RNA polymerase sigma-70 factor (ECF subfamily)